MMKYPGMARGLIACFFVLVSVELTAQDCPAQTPDSKTVAELQLRKHDEETPGVAELMSRRDFLNSLRKWSTTIGEVVFGGLLPDTEAKVALKQYRQQSHQRLRQKAGGGGIATIPFGETNQRNEYNASGIVEIGEGRLLLCDNKTGDALFELNLDAQGRKVGPLIRRPLNGADIGDPEGMAMIESEGQQFIVVTSSFNRLHGYKGKRMVPLEGFADGLLRVELRPDGSLSAQRLLGFRNWLISKYPALRSRANDVPDQGGLNIEGLAWDPMRGALLFGLRTPLFNGRPIVLPVRLTNGGSPWTTESLEALPPIVLDTRRAQSGQGIRGMCYDPFRRLFIVSLGKAISGTDVRFAQFLWDGGDFGTLRPLSKLTFSKAVKAEGITHGTLGGRGMIVYVDDGGGYLVIWDDDERLR